MIPWIWNSNKNMHIPPLLFMVLVQYSICRWVLIAQINTRGPVVLWRGRVVGDGAIERYLVNWRTIATALMTTTRRLNYITLLPTAALVLHSFVIKTRIVFTFYIAPILLLILLTAYTIFFMPFVIFRRSFKTSVSFKLCLSNNNIFYLLPTFN